MTAAADSAKLPSMDKDQKKPKGYTGSHAKGKVRCKAHGCPGHKDKNGFCTLV